MKNISTLSSADKYKYNLLTCLVGTEEILTRLNFKATGHNIATPLAEAEKIMVKNLHTDFMSLDTFEMCKENLAEFIARPNEFTWKIYEHSFLVAATITLDIIKNQENK